MNRIKIMDSCRGLAALIVAFHHMYTRLGYLYPGESTMKLHRLLSFISDLNVEAVLFFFLLSGFSIRLSLKNGMPVRKDILNEYLYRRFKRILPLYWIAITFTFVCGFLMHDLNKQDYSIRNLIGNLFFLQVSKDYKGYWFSPYGENGPLWSLSFEMFYYLFFPLFIFGIMRLFHRIRLRPFHQRAAWCIAFALSIACVALNNYVFFPYVAFSKLFFVWYSGFFLGNLYLEKKLSIDINFLLSILLTTLLGALLFLKRSDSLYQLFAGAAMATLFFVVYTLRKKVSGRFMTSLEKGFNFLFFQIGKGSYAFYLLHYPLILVLRSYANTAMWMVLLSMVVVAYISILLEELFVKRKFRVLRFQYIR